MKSEVLTQWVKIDLDGLEVNRSRIALDYATARPIIDITGQPHLNIFPDPNLFSVLIECDAATLVQIEADPNYYVLWSEA